jgi:FMN phosphatase YigB (HAD superfamily)
VNPLRYPVDQLWKSDEYLAGIDWSRYKIISLDLFDTVLFRACARPVDVFIEVAKEALLQGLLRPGIQPFEFQQIRIAAEGRARSGSRLARNHSEITLVEIYDELPERFGNIQGLMELEIAAEEKLCYLNLSMVSLIKKCISNGSKVVLVSDMYLQADQLWRILKGLGFQEAWIDFTIVSGEQGGDKSSGHLFDILLSHYSQVPAGKIIHIGDKLQADVRAPRLKGIHAVHYQAISDAADSIYSLEQLRHHELIPQLSSLRQISASLGGELGHSDFWYRFGAEVLGPFFTFFGDWIMQQCEREQVASIHPLMREGRFLTKLLMNVGLWRKNTIRVEPLFVSRQSTFLASLSAWSKEHATDLMNRRNVRIGDIFRMLDLEIPFEWKAYSELLSTESASVDCEGTTLKEKCIECITSPSAYLKINALIQIQRQRLLHYLDSVIDLDTATKWATVDIGFQGTMQKSIVDALQHAGRETDTTHFLAIGAEKIKHLLLSGYDIRGYVGNAGEFSSYVRAFLRTPDILEQLLMDDDCSTIGYEETAEGIRPVFSSQRPAFIDLHKKRRCQEGILAFQNGYYAFMGDRGYVDVWDAELRKELLQVIHRAVDFPTAVEAEQLGSLNTEDNFGSESVYPVIDESSRELVRKMGPSEFLRWTMRHYQNGRVCWPNGAVVQEDPLYLYNRYVAVADSQNYMIVFSRFIQDILKQGDKEWFVYGAGEAGQALVAVARMYTCSVRGFVESKESLH